MKEISVLCPNIDKWYAYARTHPNYIKKTARQNLVNVPALTPGQITALGAVIGIKIIKINLYFKINILN